MGNSTTSSVSPVNPIHVEVSTEEYDAVLVERMDGISDGVRMVLKSLADDLADSPTRHYVYVSTIANENLLCVDEVWRAVQFLIARNVIRWGCDRELDGDSCRCSSCFARITRVWFPLEKEPDANEAARRKVVAQQRLEREVQSLKSMNTAATCDLVGHVYLMKAGERYKIGISNNPQKRRDQLNSGQSPFHIEIIHTVQGEGYEGLERRLHDQFDSRRVRGEWFEFSPEEVAAVIESMNDWSASHLKEAGLGVD